MSEDKEKRKGESKSLLSKIMSFGARSNAAKQKLESKTFDKKKVNTFSLKKRK